MSSTSKARLQKLKAELDLLFGHAHPDDRVELVKELREYLALHKSAANRPSYDANSNAATGNGLEGVPVK